jgi:SnoaL-like domain
VDLDALGTWLDAYGRAWLSNDAADVAALFTEEATYSYGPFSRTTEGRDAIVQAWISDPEGQRDVTFEAEAIAALGQTGVGHFRVTYVPAADPRVRVELDGILVLEFAGDGRCTGHREWYAKREVPLR